MRLSHRLLAMLLWLVLWGTPSHASAPNAHDHATNQTVCDSHECRCNTNDAHAHLGILFFFTALLLGCATLQLLRF